MYTCSTSAIVHYPQSTCEEEYTMHRTLNKATKQTPEARMCMYAIIINKCKVVPKKHDAEDRKLHKSACQIGSPLRTRIPKSANS